MFEWLDERIKNAEENLKRLKDYREKIYTWVPLEEFSDAEKELFEDYVHFNVSHTDKSATATIIDYVFDKYEGKVKVK